jgi:hypothetical protein
LCRNHDWRFEVRAAKHDARIDRRGPQGEKDFLATVEADTAGADDLSDGSLLEHL